MGLKRLAHVNIRTARLGETIRFYVDVLGMRAAPIPGASDMRHAAWIFDGMGDPVVHAGDLDLAAATGGESAAAASGSGAIDHIAFEGEDIGGMIARLDTLGWPYRENVVAAAGLRQIFLRDPDDILIELNFFAGTPAKVAEGAG